MSALRCLDDKTLFVLRMTKEANLLLFSNLIVVLFFRASITHKRFSNENYNFQCVNIAIALASYGDLCITLLCAERVTLSIPP